MTAKKLSFLSRETRPRCACSSHKCVCSQNSACQSVRLGQDVTFCTEMCQLVLLEHQTKLLIELHQVRLRLSALRQIRVTNEIGVLGAMLEMPLTACCCDLQYLGLYSRRESTVVK